MCNAMETSRLFMSDFFEQINDDVDNVSDRYNLRCTLFSDKFCIIFN